MQGYVVKFKEFVVVETVVLKSVVHHTLYVSPLELLQHAGHVVRLHLASLYADDGAEVQEVAHGLAVVFRCLARFC